MTRSSQFKKVIGFVYPNTSRPSKTTKVSFAIVLTLAKDCSLPHTGLIVQYFSGIVIEYFILSPTAEKIIYN